MVELQNSRRTLKASKSVSDNPISNADLQVLVDGANNIIDYAVVRFVHTVEMHVKDWLNYFEHYKSEVEM